VVVVGGDGSVHAAVAALDRLGALDPADPIGIVSLGTGNDLARALGQHRPEPSPEVRGRGRLRAHSCRGGPRFID